MTTKLWFLPTSKTLYATADGTTYEYFMGRISGEVKDYDDAVGVISGEFAVGNFTHCTDEFNNIFGVNDEMLALLNKANQTDNNIFKFEIVETLSAANFNSFNKNFYKLTNFAAITESKYSQSSQKPCLKNYSFVDKYADRNRGVGTVDVTAIINDFEVGALTKNRKNLSQLAYKVGNLIGKALVVRHVENLQKLYMTDYASSKSKDESYVKRVNDYISRNVPSIEDKNSDGGFGLQSNWDIAYYMEKDEFTKHFKEVHSTDSEDWEGYSFLTYARGKLIFPISELKKYGRFAELNGYAFTDLLSIYADMDIRSKHLNNFISNVLLLQITEELNAFKKAAKQSFFQLQIASLFLSALISFFASSITSGLLVYLICNVVGISKNLLHSKLARTFINVESFCDLTNLLAYTKQIKINGVVLNEETECYLSYVEKIITTDS